MSHNHLPGTPGESKQEPTSASSTAGQALAIGPATEQRSTQPAPAAERLVLRFEPMDTWFFRESRPHNAVGSSELASLFPPPPRTLAGAVRTLIGDTQGVDWSTLKDDTRLREKIGYQEDLGSLVFDGPWLEQDGEVLLPAPAFLLSRLMGTTRSLARLTIGAAVETDLGSVRLPCMPKGERNYRQLEDTWLTHQGMTCVLAGGVPGIDHLREKESLLDEEPRLGIARINATRTAAESMLYQTRHLRAKPGLSVGMGVRGLDPADLPEGTALVRLGGEGRAAAVGWKRESDFLATMGPKPTGKLHGLILILLTPADLEGSWLPTVPGKTAESGAAVKPAEPGPWTRTIQGVELTIHAAVIGKAQREGGWDHASNAPRKVLSLVPAGSAWYCTTSVEIDQAISSLHGAAIGNDQKFGRGRLAVGLWLDHENQPERLQ